MNRTRVICLILIVCLGFATVLTSCDSSVPHKTATEDCRKYRILGEEEAAKAKNETDATNDEKAPITLTASSENSDFNIVAEASQSGAANFTSHVEGLLQLPTLPSGCEPVSLTIALRSMGFDLSLTEIVDNHLEYGGDIVNQFSGDPYDMGGAFPPAIVKAANSYLATQASDYAAYNLTGNDFESLVSCTKAGYPVLVWTTMYMDQPFFTGQTIDEYAWYDNEHCVVLYGIEDDQVLVSDPLEGLVTRDYAAFAEIYSTCGKMALIVL